MKTRIYVDGRITAPEAAVISVTDHGFLFGDSVYEVFWWRRGVLIQEQDHFDRLQASADRLYMDLQFTHQEMKAAIAETLAAAGATEEEDAYVRLVVTRGAGPVGLGFAAVPKRTLVVVIKDARRPDAETFERGLSVALVNRRRNSSKALDPRAKTGNYLNNALALHEARLAGSDDALMLNEAGNITEATTANVYLVKDGRLATPHLEAGILEGTTRRRILALARAHDLPTAEEVVTPAAVRAADEVFVSSSVRGILPVVAVDGTPVGDGRPGDWTRRIHTWFEAAAADERPAGTE